MDFAPFCGLKDVKTAELDRLMLEGLIIGPENTQTVEAICQWREEFRPYYNVHPVILNSILKTDLSTVKISDIKLPESLITLSFRFERSSGRKPLLICRRRDGLVITEQIDNIRHNILARKDNQVCSDVSDRWIEPLKIIVGSLMLDAEFIERDMNEKEKDKPLQYFQKVGKFGWNIGAKVEKEAREVGAHYRRPHLAIRWCGPKEESKPVLKRIKGAIVNKQKLTEIPTGYEALEESLASGASHDYESQNTIHSKKS